MSPIEVFQANWKAGMHTAAVAYLVEKNSPTLYVGAGALVYEMSGDWGLKILVSQLAAKGVH